MDHKKAGSVREFFFFNVIGVLTTLLGTGVFFLLLKLSCHYTLALAADYGIGIGFSFVMNKRFTFQIKEKATVTMLSKMVFSYVALFFGNLFLLAILVDLIGINVFWAQIVSLACLMLGSFLVQKFFVFKRVAAVLSK
jgi:putative flippase GtrA